MTHRKRPAEADCPHCGATFKAKRPACPECGSDAETGWSEDGLTGYSATDVPDTFTDEDYAAVVAGLPGADPATAPPWTPRQRWIFVVGVILVAAMVLVYVL